MKEIILTCPKCTEPVSVPANNEPFAKHTCSKKPRKFMSFVIIPLIAPEPK